MSEQQSLEEIMWPTDLPQRPNSKGYTRELATNTRESEFDRGPSRVRKISSSNLSVQTLPYIFDTDELLLFEEFYSVAEGRSFWYPNPLGETYLYVRFASGSPPRIEHDGGMHYNVIITIQVWAYVSKPIE